MAEAKVGRPVKNQHPWHSGPARDAAPATLVARLEQRRLQARGQLDPQKRATYGQFMTPYRVAQFMARLLQMHRSDEVRLLDAGAGIGSLTAAFVETYCGHHTPGRHLRVTAYEIDPALTASLRHTLRDCQQYCYRTGIAFDATVCMEDFLAAATRQLLQQSAASSRFTHAILNPPYKKIPAASIHRQLLRSLGIVTGNLYTAFLAVTIQLLEPGGEMVAIIPRSFCNGPYFTAFRRLLLETMALRHIHIFDSRKQAFQDDAVLQETMILYAVKQTPQERLTLSHSHGLDFTDASSREVALAQVVLPQDPQCFLHLVVSEAAQRSLERMRALPCTLADLGVAASTGPVVDFRLQDYLCHEPGAHTVPLIYPAHCQEHFVTWPLPGSRKPNAITDVEAVRKWLYPNGYYTLVRRFSAKEERRRIVAVVHDPARVPGEKIGFENHLNVLHCQRHGLSQELARGLAVYLNSTLVDCCFRQFNGHTQVNVQDLYTLRYPTKDTLIALGKRAENARFPTQEDIDAWVDRQQSG